MSYSRTLARCRYERQCREVTASKLQKALAKTLWTPLSSLLVSTKQRVRCRCLCGRESSVRAADLLAGQSRSCRSCASRLKAAKLPIERRVAIAKQASDAAAAAVAARISQDPYRVTYGAAFDAMLRLASTVRQRCCNPNAISYSNYGGRGITFGFPSRRAFAEWVLDNLGPKPDHAYSLDRIDNNRGYEPGNLRWATRSEQARNKRPYRRTKAGERIRRLKEFRPDLTYETLRVWITQGATDEDIVGRRKYARSCV